MLSFLNWEKICNDPITGLNLVMVIAALVIIIPLLANAGNLFHEIFEYLFAPREYPWVRGLGRKAWLDKKEKGKLAWEK